MPISAVGGEVRLGQLGYLLTNTYGMSTLFWRLPLTLDVDLTSMDKNAGSMKNIKYFSSQRPEGSNHTQSQRATLGTSWDGGMGCPGCESSSRFFYLERDVGRRGVCLVRLCQLSPVLNKSARDIDHYCSYVHHLKVLYARPVFVVS